MGKMTVYHGSYTTIEKPEIIIGKNTKDFGQGFYCTVIREQAERWAKRYKTSIVNAYTVSINTDLKILEFTAMTEDWLDFIIRCRQGVSHNYDLVIGAIANDQIYNYIADYMNGILTREQFWIMAKFKYPTHQINFCTKKALLSINYVSSEVIEK
ncbi:MAG: DUF3990 domain-containing protein [Lachnoclostridium sp.]|jgi:hypothetical protein|nr:DUF3990 domain-containing protein [Lachnoclostridium sp.]